jgi:tyrosyl-tRNA synthetase
VGHLLQQCTLRRLQLGGHRPIALAGGGTGMVGDPRPTAGERPLLTHEDLQHNLAGIRVQLERFCDFTEAAGERRALLLDNGEWLGQLGLIDFLRDVGKHFTVNQMVAKEAVKARFERPDDGISYTEFSYMLLQAYDYLTLFDRYHCTLQIGGSDQWGNITMGVDLVRRVRSAAVHGLTTPLVLKADGTKFGKTESGTVWLDPARTSPYRLYQFLVNTEDAVVGTYLRYFTFLSHEAILELDGETAERPQRRSAARALAREVCTLVHGADETAKAERAAAALFEGSVADLPEATLLDVMDDAPSSTLARHELVPGPLSIVDLLVRSGLCSSRGEARRTVEQGGAYLNGVRAAQADQAVGAEDLRFDRYLVLRRGSRRYHLVKVDG